MRGTSQGFSFLNYPDMERPSLSYQFRRDDIFGGNGPFIDLEVVHHVHIKLGTLSLFPAEEVQSKIQMLNTKFVPNAASN
jgi:hypothetical protein